MKVKLKPTAKSVLACGLDTLSWYDAKYSGNSVYEVSTKNATYFVSQKDLVFEGLSKPEESTEMKEGKTVKVQVLSNFATSLTYGLDFEETYDATLSYGIDGAVWYIINTDIGTYTLSRHNVKIIEDTAPSEDFLLHKGELLRIIGMVSSTSGESLGFAVQGHVISAPIVVQDYTRVRELSFKDMRMLKDASPILVLEDGETLYRHYARSKAEYPEILTYANGCTSHTTIEYESYNPNNVHFFEIIDNN